MAEGFEPYHVPQQSRRDKLRVVAAAAEHSPAVNLPGLMLPPPPTPYDPASLIISSSSDLLTSCTPTTKEEVLNNNSNSSNLMGLTSSSSNFRSPYLDPQFHDINNNPGAFFHYSSQVALQNDDDQVVVFKPEPLSLSLSSSSYSNSSGNHHHNSLPAIYGSIVAPNDGVSRSSVPLGPFTGYASILKGSRFLKPAQQLLEEFCDVGGGGGGICCEKIAAADSSLMDPQVESLSADGSLIVDHDDHDHNRHQLGGSSDIGVEIRKKKSRLISMLDEVYRRYKQYYQQMQAVVTSFEYVAGLGNAAPYANLAVKAMTRHFKCLKNAIMDQLQFTNKDSAHASHGKDEAPMFRNSNRGLYGQRPIHSTGFLEHQPVWRPQRGLPERAVTVLRAWLFEHFLHPYPTDTDKLMLAKQTGLSRSQVSNWFINARVRLWKPMVEEIHMLETRQAQKSAQREDRNANRSSDHMQSANSLASENPSTSTHRVQDTSKRTRNELPNMPVGSEEMNLSYETLPSHLQVGAAGMSMAGSGNGVSLTLGLHQNNGIGLSEPFPINAAQRFGLGLEGNSEGYNVMSTFEAQNRHFGRDVIGGQLLHDFVG
ncbi:BEL1-like homeodomain protein 9 [Morus notabilis]|uniref:BEL1-like homeodomain protein 9 n=1 Tax=Morus notabilis TaxID=981085 RepID=W9QN79_9ROSA|nr:BEL1-like homeodomain protein 9 [Morus notabilis]EXB36701.1 BEL1-like homeodomain protein 9 [Morus notabilis]